ncbi:hypothetical protein [Candidatus Chloroploca asiatica]|uniref:Transposase n=1 Tax=Candidatus Chloroploca asiatica TaxID=1506545 RepID=A0A2H3L9A9_9CHLR|nr:hypothetical protein [Candidatus Chloroploca asiatica]PDV99910.1 hypothetical protein A9Q02_01480 [Candidatus Chloroploca asiatica]
MAATDHPLKRVVALAGLDLAAWVLGQAVEAVEAGQGALLAEPEILDTDLVLRVTLATGEEVILHVEFQGPGSKRPMPLRVLEYQARLADLGARGPVTPVNTRCILDLAPSPWGGTMW